MSATRPQATQEDVAIYTPVAFPDDSNKAFESSLPSLSSISGFSANLTYLEDLQRKHHALAQIVREEPPSPPRLSDDSDDGDFDEVAFLAAREERITTLRQRVREAYIKAEGNPADGKWVFLTHLLRMESTSGRYGRWAGTRTDRKPPEPLEGAGSGLGWINADSEAEWREWERRYYEERRVKDKVESWKRSVLPPSKGPSLAMEGPHSIGSVAARPDGPSTSNHTERPLPAQDSQATKTKVIVKAAGAAAPADPLRDAAPFGFRVVKRASQNQNIAGGKPSKPAASGAGGKKPDGDRPSRHDQPPADPPSSSKEKEMNVKRIADLPDTSFLPSFSSSQFLTSTPKPNAKPPSKPITNDPQPQPQLYPQGNHIPAPLFLPSPSPPVPLLPAAPVMASTSVPAPAPATALLPAAPVSPASPRVTKTYGRRNHDQDSTPGTTPKQKRPLETSASLPVIPIPATPTRQRHVTPPGPARHAAATADTDNGAVPIINANNKRSLPPPTTPTRTGTGTPNQREEEDVERALKKARTMSTLELMASSPSKSPGLTRNRPAHQQTLTGFSIARSRSPRTPRPAPQAKARPAGSGIGVVGPSTPTLTPTPGPVRESSNTRTPSVPPPPAVQSLLPPLAQALLQAPSTPPPAAAGKKSALPTLTELLASAKKKKGPSTISSKSVKPASKGNLAVEAITEVEEREEVAAALVSAVAAPVDVSAVGGGGDSEAQVHAQVGVDVEPQSGGSGGSGGHSDSYPNAPAYAYPTTDDVHNLHAHPLLPLPRINHLDSNDPHADADPYAEPPERDSIFGGDVEIEFDPYANVDLDLASPAKSFSSIAGSDDEDEEEEVDQLAGDGDDIFGERMGKGLGEEFEFKPLATSTQQGPFGRPSSPAAATNKAKEGGSANQGAGNNVATDSPQVSQRSKDSWESVYASPSKSSFGPAPSGVASSTSHHPQAGSHPSSSNPFTYAYNSQFESTVAKEVEKVNKLLESEIRVDYEGWLNLKEHNDDDDKGVEESP